MNPGKPGFNPHLVRRVGTEIAEVVGIRRTAVEVLVPATKIESQSFLSGTAIPCSPMLTLSILSLS